MRNPVDEAVAIVRGEGASEGSPSERASRAAAVPDHRRGPRVVVLSREQRDPVAPPAVTSRRACARVEDVDIDDDEDGSQTVRIVGELDLPAACSVLRELIAALDRGEGLLVVDLDSLTFINSSGLLALESASRCALERHRVISFINPHPLARQVFAQRGSEQVIVDGAASGSSRGTSQGRPRSGFRGAATVS